MIVAILFILGVSFTPLVHSAGYNDFVVKLSRGGWNDNGNSLTIRIGNIICSPAGVCMINGYGFETGQEGSVLNFEGNMLNDGTTLHVWVKGEGRGTTPQRTMLVYYDIYMKINVANPEYPLMNSFHLATHTNFATQDKIYTGSIEVTFYY